VNSEGRVQLANRATFPPGEAKEDWAILRRFRKWPRGGFPTTTSIRCASRLSPTRRISRRATRRRSLQRRPCHMERDRAPGAVDAKLALESRLRISTSPIDRASERDHGGVFAPLRPTRPNGGGIGHALRPSLSKPRSALRRCLVFLAGHRDSDALGQPPGDAGVPFAVRPQSVGGGSDAPRTQCSGAFGLLQSFADFIKFVLKELIIPAGANKGVFLLAPLVAFTLAMAAWAVVPVGPAG